MPTGGAYSMLLMMCGLFLGMGCCHGSFLALLYTTALRTCGVYIRSRLYFTHFYFYLPEKEPSPKCKLTFGPVLLYKCQPARREPGQRQGHVRSKGNWRNANLVFSEPGE